MKVILPLLNKPGIPNINRVTYDKDSYIESIKEHIKIFRDSKMPVYIYRYERPLDLSMERFCACDLSLVIGELIEFDEENFTIELKIYDQYEDEFKNNINSYYIILRMLADFPKLDRHAIIKRVVRMEIHNDPANIAKEEM